MNPTPHVVNHIGLTVPDVFAPRVLEAASHATHETRSIFGPRFRKAYQAHMLAANGVGRALFQFVEPPVERPTDNFEYWKAGVFHIGITDPEVAAMARRIVATGGRQREEAASPSKPNS